MPDRISFVLCVESGPLESMTVRAIESLRLFGGRFARAPVFAVTPRWGPPLSGSTRRRFRHLDVEHVRLARPRRFAWYHYLNKPVALAAVEARADSELVAFLDSDTLVLEEPTALDIASSADFTASFSDVSLGGTTGSGHPNEPGWRRICALTGIAADDLPWMTTPLEGARIRLYFNSGVFAYRRGTRVGAQQLELLLRALRGGVRLPGSASRMLEQVVLAPLVVARRMHWRPLPFSHNSTMISVLPYEPKHLREARILHYHDSMATEHWPDFIERLTAERPAVAPWLRELGPVDNPASAVARTAAQSLRVSRGVRRRANKAMLRLRTRRSGKGASFPV